jgi:hypothetical protein
MMTGMRSHDASILSVSAFYARTLAAFPSFFVSMKRKTIFVSGNIWLLKFLFNNVTYSSVEVYTQVLFVLWDTIS